MVVLIFYINRPILRVEVSDRSRLVIPTSEARRPNQKLIKENPYSRRVDGNEDPELTNEEDS